MAQFDLPLAELQRFQADSVEPEDLDAFWAATLEDAERHPLGLRLEPVDNRLRLVDTFDVSFAGHGGQRVAAWLHVPADRDPRGLIVRFRGYSEGRGLPLGHVFVDAGFAVVELDSRGQGWAGSQLFASTPDAGGGANSAPGLLTRGLAAPGEHYYARLYTDAVRLTRAAPDLPGGASGVVVAGGSQGGALAVAAAALSGVELRGALVDVPFLCHIRRAVALVDTIPYAEVAVWLRSHPHEVEHAYGVLAYLDGVHLAARARCPALFSVGLEDTVCPPSTVFAAFNAWRGAPKEIGIYHHNGHEGGQQAHVWRQLEWLSAAFGV